MAELEVCESCCRHVRRTERSCPFCGGRVCRFEPDRSDTRRGLRFGRAVLAGSAAVVITVSASACYGAPCDDCPTFEPDGGKNEATASGGTGGSGASGGSGGAAGSAASPDIPVVDNGLRPKLPHRREPGDTTDASSD